MVFFLHLTSGRMLLPTDFLTLRLLEMIYSLKWYFAPFSRCKLCLHPKLSPLNTLDHAKWTRNDWDKVQFWSNIFLKYVENISIFTHAHSWKYWFFQHIWWNIIRNFKNATFYVDCFLYWLDYMLFHIQCFILSLDKQQLTIKRILLRSFILTLPRR